MQPWFAMRADEAGDGEVLIYDEIGARGVTARQFVDDLKALGPVRDLAIRINSPGGSGFDAVAIYNALARHPARKAVWVDGFAASAASIVAMAGDEIVMPENTMMMIHDPVAMATGGAEEMRAIAGALDRAKTAMVGIYAAKSERSADEIGRLMRDETWMSAQEAFDLGFADRVTPAVAIAARFNARKFQAKRLPDAVAALLKEVPMPDDEPAAAPQAAVDAEAAGVPAVPAEPPIEAAPPPAQTVSATPGEVPAEAPVIAAAARQTALAYAREVADLCALAGFADRAAKFLEVEATVAQVREALLEARARVDAEIVVDASRQPSAGRMPADAGWGDAIARVFKQ